MQSPDFYRDEHPLIDTGDGGGSGGRPSGGWSGIGGGGGLGHGGGIPPRGRWFWNSPDSDFDEPPVGTWEGENDKEKNYFNAPYMKIDRAGAILSDPENCLLLGDLTCEAMPSILIWTEDGHHADCVILESELELEDFSSVHEAESENPPQLMLWNPPQNGEYTFYAAWQKGHYDHSKCGKLRFDIYGITIPFLTVPLGRSIKIANIKIMNGSVYVNGAAGDIRGCRGWC